VKALVLEGDAARETKSFAEVTAAYRAGKTFWVELDDRSEDANALLEKTLGIHPLAIEDVWSDVGLPKVEDFGEYIQVILHGIRESGIPTDAPLTLVELDILIGKNFLVTHAHDEKVCAVTPVQDELK
jgi:Mg2+ and Co2+ transporter CorA